MNSSKNPLRPVGQRAITSSFIFHASNRSNDCNRDVETEAPSGKGPRISLSDFLDRKLHRGSVLPTSGNEKTSPSPSRGVKGESEKNEGIEKEVKSLTDGAFDFNIFKNIKKAHTPNETEIIDVDDLEQTRKRKCLFEDHDDKPTGPKRLAVLGDDSKPQRRSVRKSFTREERKPLFNHYEHGGGWWTENMAGVDNEEVGCTDAWEGVGCTTLGGIEWH